MKATLNFPRLKRQSTIANIAFFGSADVDEQNPVYQEAFKIARFLAYQGKVIVNGGGPGVMDASTKGAQAGGGKTIGVTFYPNDMPEFEGRYYKNIVDKEIKTVSYVERMFGLMDNADAFICFEGGTGTLSEWATAWLLAHLHYGNHKPLILYGEFWHEVLVVINKHFFLSEKENSIYKIASNEDELIAALNYFEHELAERCGLPKKEETA